MERVRLLSPHPGKQKECGKFSAPHPTSKLLVQMLTVFWECWRLDGSDALRMAWGRALGIFYVLCSPRGSFRPASLGLGKQEAGHTCSFLQVRNSGSTPRAGGWGLEPAPAVFRSKAALHGFGSHCHLSLPALVPAQPGHGSPLWCLASHGNQLAY